MKISQKTSVWALVLSLFSMVYVNSEALALDKSVFKVKSQRAHEITILNNGLASLEKRLEMIERARKFIDVEYFIYHTDTSGRIFTQALVKKAKAGVKVRILVDTFMVAPDLTPFYAYELGQYGIEVKYFNTAGPLNFKYGQYRNHRKLLAIDGKEAMTGGRNIGDEYFDLNHEYNFLDRDIYVKGEIAASIAKSFNDVFNSEVSEPMDREHAPKKMSYSGGAPGKSIGGKSIAHYRSDLRKWETKVQEAKDFLTIPDTDEAMIRDNAKNFLAEEYEGVCHSMTFESEYPLIGKKHRLNSRVLKYGLLERIKSAKKEVMIDSPYFIVNSELGQALDVSLNKKEKVDVTLLTNSLNSTDAIYVYANFDSHIKEWIAKDLEPYIFKGQRPHNYQIIKSKAGNARFGVHAKTFVFDKKDTIIGTYNVDPRSANYNTEMILSCEDNQEVAEVVLDDIHSRIDGSFHLNSDQAVKDYEFYETGFFKKMLYYLTKGPANGLSFLL